MGYFKGCVQSTGHTKECDKLSPPPGHDGNDDKPPMDQQKCTDANCQEVVLRGDSFSSLLLTIYSENAWDALKRARTAGIIAVIAVGFSVLCSMSITQHYKKVQDSPEPTLRKVVKLVAAQNVLMAISGICFIVCAASLRAIVDGRNSWLRGTFGQDTSLQYESSSGHTLTMLATAFIWFAIIWSIRGGVFWRRAAAAAKSGTLQSPQGAQALLTPSPPAAAPAPTTQFPGTYAHVVPPPAAAAQGGYPGQPTFPPQTGYSQARHPTFPPQTGYSQAPPHLAYPGKHAPPMPQQQQQQQQQQWGTYGQGAPGVNPVPQQQQPHSSAYPAWTPSAPPASGL